MNPISLTLLDEKGRTVLSSPGTRPISRSVWKRLNTDIQQPLLRDRDTQFHAVPIRGGMAVWQEDLSQINRLRREIQDMQTRLEAANALLREEGEVKKRLLAAQTNQALFEQLDWDMERRITSLANLIETLAGGGAPWEFDRLHHPVFVSHQTQMQPVFPGPSGGTSSWR